MPTRNQQADETKGALRSGAVNSGIAALLAAGTLGWNIYTGDIPATPENVGTAMLGAAGGIGAIWRRVTASQRIRGLF